MVVNTTPERNRKMPSGDALGVAYIFRSADISVRFGINRTPATEELSALQSPVEAVLDGS